jgi:cell division protein FtsI/penicillin-binding protein 2
MMAFSKFSNIAVKSNVVILLENFEKAIIYDRNGKQLMQSSNENMINFKPDIDFVDPETSNIAVKSNVVILFIDRDSTKLTISLELCSASSISPSLKVW